MFLLNFSSSFFEHQFIQGTDSFYNSLLPFAQAGCSLGTCTGTCSWSSFAGYPKTSLNNGYAAGKAANKLGGASCLSVTAHWSSHPALGHIVFAWPGFIIGAGQSWNASTPKVIQIKELRGFKYKVTPLFT